MWDSACPVHYFSLQGQLLKLMQIVSVSRQIYDYHVWGMESRFCQTFLLKLLIMSKLDIFSLMFVGNDDKTFFLTASHKPVVDKTWLEFSQSEEFLSPFEPS